MRGIGRNYKEITDQEKSRIFGKGKQFDSTRNLETQFSDEQDPMHDIAYDEFISAYHSDTPPSPDVFMDFAILVNKYRHQHGDELLSDTETGELKKVLRELRGTEPDSIKKYIVFMLDFIFEYRPKDGLYLIDKVMSIIPHGEAGIEEFYYQLKEILSQRRNKISDEQLAAAELEYKGEVYNEPEKKEAE